MDTEIEVDCPGCGAATTEVQHVIPGGGVRFEGACGGCGYEWSGSA